MIFTQIEKFISPVIEVAGLIAIVSFFVMFIFLYRHKMISFTSFINPIWYKIAFIYRDYTQEKRGKVGLLYYIFVTSIFVLIPLFIFEIISCSYDAPKPIFWIICISILLFAPLIGFVVFMLSRDKYI